MDIKTEIIALPDKIRTCETSLADITENALLLQKDADFLEMQIKAEVSGEKDGDKKRFPNEDLRNAEYSLRLGNSETYGEKMRELSELRKIQKAREIELHYFLNFFSALKAIARMSESS